MPPPQRICTLNFFLKKLLKSSMYVCMYILYKYEELCTYRRYHEKNSYV